MRRLAIAVLLLVVLLGCAPPAFAQGCALCRTAAEAAGPEAGKALNRGILVLLIPTLSIFLGVLFFAFRYRYHSGADEAGEDTRVSFRDSSPF
ncbi:MAG: hypothetical protein ACE5HL_06635 [Terriglobia bacterium]